MSSKSTAVISGAGPSGLAMAIKMHQLGWSEIYVIEQREALGAFDRGKAFNYQLDGRGQKMLADIGIDETTVQAYGVANLKSVFTTFDPTGDLRTLTIPFVLEDKQTAYWITRNALLEMLYSRLEEVNTDGRIKMMYDHKFDSIAELDGRRVARVVDHVGQETLISATLIVGCDGLNSNVRKSLAADPSLTADDYEMVAKASPSSSLLYKVICLPATIAINGDSVEVSDNLKSYIFSSTYKDFDEKLALFSLPVAREGEQRTANIILPATHKLWHIDDPKELRSYLEKGFPQLDIDEVFPPNEIEDFLARRPGKFPDPQYSPKVYAKVGAAQNHIDCILIGDAAHSFPPDLGLGVNSALEDVYLFGTSIEAHPGDLEMAATTYEAKRLPESKALVRLVRKVFPYQYNHVPWRFALSLSKIIAQMKLHKWSHKLIDEPTFRLCQDERISYTELERRMIRTDVYFYGILTSIVGLISFLVYTAIFK